MAGVPALENVEFIQNKAEYGDNFSSYAVAIFTESVET